MSNIFQVLSNYFGLENEDRIWFYSFLAICIISAIISIQALI